MGFIDKAVAGHFKASLTGETVFFFRVWLLPSTRAGYVVTSDDDIQTLKRHLRRYYGFVNIWIVSALTIFGTLLARFAVSRWAPGSDYLPEIVVATVMAVAVATIAGLVFRNYVLGPIICKYPTAHPMMEYVDTEEESGGWRRPNLVSLLLVAGAGIWFLYSGETMAGVFMLAIAGFLFVHAVREHRARSRKRTLGYASNPRL